MFGAQKGRAFDFLETARTGHWTEGRTFLAVPGRRKLPASAIFEVLTAVLLVGGFAGGKDVLLKRYE
jgi:hypothetical protein